MIHLLILYLLLFLCIVNSLTPIIFHVVLFLNADGCTTGLYFLNLLENHYLNYSILLNFVFSYDIKLFNYKIKPNKA